MNRLSRELVRSLKETERNLGNPTFRWADKDIPCSPNQATMSKILGLGGEALSADLILFVRKEALPTPGPKEKQQIQYGGHAYQIDKIALLPGDEIVSFVCIDAVDKL